MMRYGTRQFQLHEDHVHQRPNGWPTRFHYKSRRFSVQRITLRVQLAQARQRVSHLQQWAIDVVPQAPKQLIGVGLQVNHRRALLQAFAIERPQNRATAGGKNSSFALGEFIQNGLLHVPKAAFSLAFKVFTDGASQPRLDHMVGVQKRALQSPGELPPDGGLARAREAY